MQYEPKKMDAAKVLKEIKNVYKLVKQEDIVGDLPARGPMLFNGFNI